MLALKWSGCEKFRDYLIGSKFTVLTDNNPLTYVCTSHIGASQIRWLSNLTLFDFDIKYRAGKTDQAADAVSQRPVNPNSSSESSDGEEEWETISYEVVAKSLIIIWILVNYPVILNTRFKSILQMSVKLIHQLH